MKLDSFVGLAAVLAAAPLLAQSSPSSRGSGVSGIESLTQGPLSTVTVSSHLTACPLSMHALQGSGHGLVAVRVPAGKNAPAPENPERRLPGQQIHLVLATPNGMKPVTAHIDVYGRSGANHVEQTRGLGGINAHDYERRQTLDVDFSPENDGEVAADLKLPGFTSIKSIQLESVTYEDGSTWRVGAGQACHVAPDPLMLVADR